MFKAGHFSFLFQESPLICHSASAAVAFPAVPYERSLQEIAPNSAALLCFTQTWREAQAPDPQQEVKQHRSFVFKRVRNSPVSGSSVFGMEGNNI